MIKVRKGNVTYRIYDESQVQEFLNDGFKEVKQKKKTEAIILNTDEEDAEDKETTTKRRRN